MDPAAASPSSVEPIFGSEETLGSSIQRQPGGLYFYADVLIRSAWSLGVLPPAEDTVAGARTIGIDLLAAPPREPSKTDWVHHWPSEDGGMSLALLREEDSFLLRFIGLADFVIAADGLQIEAWPAPSTGAETLEHLLLDQVLPRILARQGQLVSHAGAVRVGDQAIAFIGNSGSGKSTLTASFHAAGYSVLCDDGLVLTFEGGATLALPTYPGLRLSPGSIAGLYAQAPASTSMAHYSSKRRLILKDIASNGTVPLPLASLYVLWSKSDADDAGISLGRLSRGAACMAIIGNSFQLDITDRRSLANAFANASRIAEHLPVFSLCFPHDFACLPELHEAILRQHTENEQPCPG
jgi:hypothetical protein